MNIPQNTPKTSPQNIAFSSNSVYDSPNAGSSVSGSSSLFCTSPLVPIHFNDHENTSYTNWSLKYNTHNLPPASPPSPYTTRKGYPNSKSNPNSITNSTENVSSGGGFDDGDIFEFNLNDQSVNSSAAVDAGQKSFLTDSLQKSDGTDRNDQSSKWKIHESDRKKISQFFSNHTCFDLMPTSGKVVAISSKISLRVAIKALLENDIMGVSVWDQTTYEFCGMFTVSDCAHVFSHYYKYSPNEDISFFFDQTIETLRNSVPSGHKKPIFGQPDNTLLETCHMLIDNRIHRIPIIDPETNNLLQIVNTDQLLRFLIFNLPTKRREFLQRTLGELEIGSFGNNTPRVNTHTPFSQVLELLFPYQTPGVLILNPDDTLFELYSKNDLLYLANCNDLKELPEKPIIEIIDMMRFERVKEKCMCQLSDTLLEVVEKILSTKKRRAVIVDPEHKVVGLVTMWDILHFLIV